MNTSSTESVQWTWEEEKAFENAIGELALNNGDEIVDLNFTEIAQRLNTKSQMEVKLHYEILMQDLDAIDNGRVPIPEYVGEEKDESEDGNVNGRGNREIERRRGTPWTEEEHRRFLEGLKMYGKGDWRSISRGFVKTRTPTQVASHAQKYFNRVHTKRASSRMSIHDIRLPNDNHAVSSSQTGPSSSSMAVQPPSLQHQKPLMNSAGYPMQGHMTSAEGAPGMHPAALPRGMLYDSPDPNSILSQMRR